MNKCVRLNSSTGNHPLPTLPFDLILEILYRVPPKSLIQFKSVCKSWKSLISDHKFGRKHLSVSTTRHRILYSSFTNPSRIKTCNLSIVFTKKVTVKAITATATTLEYPLKNREIDFIIIIGSCHGILCIQLPQSSVILWNPSIRKFTELPFLEIIPKPKKQSCTDTNYGFGYDNSTDTYKVVAVSYPNYNSGNCNVQTHVHTMGTNFWRRIEDFPCVPIWGPGKFVSGAVNFLVKDSAKVIVSLDLEKESYRKLLLHAVTKTLCVLKDCLSILSSGTGCSEVWLMKEYGNEDSWTKLFRVPRMGGDGYGPIKAVYLYENDKLLLDYLTKLVVYNSIDGTFKTKVQNCSCSMTSEVFQESLISPC